MSSLPDRYGQHNGPPHVVTNNLLVSLGFAVGACGVAIMGMSLQVKTGEFYNFSNYVLDVLKQTQFVVYTGYASLLLGFLGIISGTLLGIAGLVAKKLPCLSICALVLLLITSTAHIAAGTVVLEGVTLVDDAIYKQGSATPAEGSFTSQVIHLQLAMFNGCCASAGWTREVTGATITNPDAIDTSGYVKYCNAIHPLNLAAIRQTSSLRSCYNSQEEYRVMNFTVARNLPRICQTLTDSFANIAGKKVPGTTTDVTTATRGVVNIPIVGFNDQPTYGCGIGYAKAFQAAMLIWVENILQPVSTAFLVCGALEFFFFILGIVATCCCGNKTETTNEAYARYMEEIGSSQKPQNNEFEQHNPGRPISVANNHSQHAQFDSQRMSLQSTSGPATANPVYNQQRASVQNPNNRLSMQNPGNRMSTQSQHSQPGQPPQQPYPQYQPSSMVAFNVDDKI